MAYSADKFCSDAPYFGVIDGNVLPNAPTQITIDQTCTFVNWPTSKPLSTNINFQTNDDSIYLIIFDNVFYTGNMACANIPHKLWVVNSREDAFSGTCQDIIIPPETISKQASVSVIGIGEEFTYRLILPYMLFPDGSPSPNDIGDVVMTDNLDALGAVVTLVGTPSVTFAGTGLPVPHTFTQSAPSGGLLTFDFDNTIISGQQVYVDITVRVEDDPANTAGTQILNVAEWEFSRSIDLDENGIIEDGTVDLDGDGRIEDEFFNPLPGEAGIAEPVTIGEPSLVVTKTANQTALNIGVNTVFTIDVENVGGANAWDTTITDYLPDVPAAPAGMCDTDPGATVTAEIFEADGITTVSGPLTLGVDFTVSYTGAPTCEFSLTTTSANAVIGPTQRLLVSYQSQLDADTTGDNEALTNIAGADLWYSGPNTAPSRRTFDMTITDGTPLVLDFQDDYTVTTALSGYYFEKTASNVETGAYPAVAAALGDTIQYTLRLFNIDQTIDNIVVTDVLDTTRFDLSTFAMVDDGGASYSLNPLTGELLINGGGGSLNVAAGDEFAIVFQVDLLTTLSNGDVAENQATLSADQNTPNPGDDFVAVSDDPFVNGVADPTVDGDEDATSVTVQTPGPLNIVNGQASAAIGEQFTYRITIPDTPIDLPLYDVRVLDDFSASAADIAFVSAVDLSGHGWALLNTGTPTNAVIEDTTTGIDIPAGEQAVIEVRVQLLNTATNQSGLFFSNSATYSYNRLNNLVSSRIDGSADSGSNMAVVEPDLSISKSVSFASPGGKTVADTATVGDVLEYQVTLVNTGNSTAYDISVSDALPAFVSYVPGSATAELNNVAVVGFVATPDALVSGELIWGDLNEDPSLDIPVGQSLVLTYRVTVDDASSGDVINSVVAEWTSLDNAAAGERNGLGCPAITAPDDYCSGPATVTVSTADNSSITKLVVDDSYAESPASTGDPVLRVGDTVTYDLSINLQEYTTRSVVIEDVLPAGMAFDSTVSISPASGADSFTYTVASEPSAGDTGTLSWDLGDVQNTPSGDATPIDQLVLRYVARVITDAAPLGISTATSSLLTNNASLSYSGGDPLSYPSRLTTTELINVLQPAMSVISKVDVGAGRSGTGVSFDPYQVDILSDTMNFELSSCNTGLAPAYGVLIRDQFPVELDESDLAASPPVVTVGAATLSAGVDYTLSLPARGGTLEITLQDSAPIEPGECISVRYDVGFHTDIAPYSTWNNTATLAEYRSLPLALSGRVYTPSDTAQIFMTNQIGISRLVKLLTSGSEATIGDEVVYLIVVPSVPVNATLDNVVVTDMLSPVLEYVSATAIDSNGDVVALVDNSIAPDQVELTINQIVAGEQVVIRLTTRVQNNADANAGVSVSNTAAYDYTGLDPAADTSGSSAPFTVVEPDLSISKSLENITTPGARPIAGDVLRYTLTFTAAATAGSDAFDLQIDDSLSLGLLYQSGSAVVDGNGNTVTDPLDNSGDGVSTAQILTWDLASASADIDVTEGSQVQLSYDVLVLADVEPGQTLTNSATVRWTSQDGDSVYERDGSNTPVENDYLAGPASTSILSRLDVDVVKSVVNDSSGQDPGTEAEPGDILRYTIVLTNNSIIPVTNAVFTDVLDTEIEAGSLQLLSYPAAADISATDSAGGANNTGIIDIRNFTLAATGDPGGEDSVSIEFTVQLAEVLDSGSAVLNTGQLSGDNLAVTPSNTTSTIIDSAPLMQVEKISADMSGDADVLLTGDTLRYTITVKNIGNENAVNVTLRDLIPTFTTYVAGSTTLNGIAVSDPAAGVSPLQDGLLINAPEDTTSGALRADSSDTADNVATIVFDVTINPAVVGGTAITNQGFVNGDGAGASGAFNEMPSDDPTTDTPYDPTVDVVGYVPLLDAQKTVALYVDNDADGLIDAGDVLRYTIVITNQGIVDASEVMLVDAVPANTTYYSDSLFLNGNPVGQPDGGVSPLIAGIAVNSDDGAASGVISADGTATIVFDVTVNGGVTPGTLISNQGVVSSQEQNDEPTDADGIDSNGDQPTVSIVGDIQLVSIVKQVFDVNGGIVLAGDELEYVITVRNISPLPTTDLRIYDDLDLPVADQLHYVEDSATINGNANGVSFTDPLISVDYGANYGDLAPGASAVLRFRAMLDPDLAVGTTVINTAQAYWNADTQSAAASVSIVVGAPPVYTASIGGTVWHDIDNDKVPANGEALLENWTVELYRNTTLLASVNTDANGAYGFIGLAPNDTSSAVYNIRFVAPGAGPDTALLGVADSPFDDALHYINNIVVPGNAVLNNLNLPLLPNGVVYDSIARVPVAGAVLVMRNAATQQLLSELCFDDAAQQGQVTPADGFYRFDINFSDPSCPVTGSYLIELTRPSDLFEEGASRLVPPISNETTDAYEVPGCLGSTEDAVPATADICEVVASPFAPPVSVEWRSPATNYYLHLAFDNTLNPGQSQLFNNHIPLDPLLDTAVAVRKVAGKVNVSRGDLVPYTITIENAYLSALQDLTLVDTFPPGFKYVEGSARLNGEPVEPVLTGGQLRWNNIDLEVDATSTVELLFIPGAGVSEGEYLNRAHVEIAFTGDAVSNTAAATVRVVPDPTLDCSDILGKVFEDKNLNGYPDKGEPGIGGARVVTARGLLVTADQHGRFHVTCAAVPNEARGSNFILKLDERSLPSGYRVISENPRVMRLTRGKAVKFNFGVALHRVVRIDVAAGVFEHDDTRLRPQWLPRIPMLIAELQKSPSILRISYLADVEDESLVKERVKSIKRAIIEQWEDLDCCYKLEVETEIYWRRGAPPERGSVLK